MFALEVVLLLALVLVVVELEALDEFSSFSFANLSAFSLGC